MPKMSRPVYGRMGTISEVVFIILYFTLLLTATVGFFAFILFCG